MIFLTEGICEGKTLPLIKHRLLLHILIISRFITKWYCDIRYLEIKCYVKLKQIKIYHKMAIE